MTFLQVVWAPLAALRCYHSSEHSGNGVHVWLQVVGGSCKRSQRWRKQSYCLLSRFAKLYALSEWKLMDLIAAINLQIGIEFVTLAAVWLFQGWISTQWNGSIVCICSSLVSSVLFNNVVVLVHLWTFLKFHRRFLGYMWRGEVALFVLPSF